MLPEPVTYVLVEDDDVDVMILKRTMKKLGLENPMLVARDGREGLELLKGQNGKKRPSKPYIVLLDLNMPRMNGFEFLRSLRADDKLKDSVVFVLTTSSYEKDVHTAYEMNVAGYMLKHDQPDRSFADTLSMINKYAHVVELPRQ